MDYQELLNLAKSSLITDTSEEGVSFGRYKISWTLPKLANMPTQIASDKIKTEMYKLILDNDPIFMAKGIFTALNDDGNKYRTIEDYIKCINLVEGALNEIRAFYTDTLDSNNPYHERLFAWKIRQIDHKLAKLSEYKDDHDLFEEQTPSIPEKEINEQNLALIRQGKNPDLLEEGYNNDKI